MDILNLKSCEAKLRGLSISMFLSRSCHISWIPRTLETFLLSLSHHIPSMKRTIMLAMVRPISARSRLLPSAM